jgi:anti-sigma factor RsiW
MNGAGECAQIRNELGVYVLGAIEPGERARVGRHVAWCSRCRDELAGLAGLPGLLRTLTAGQAVRTWSDEASDAPPGPPLVAVISQVRRIRCRRRRLAAAAAGVLLAGVAAVTGLRVFQAQAASPPDTAEPRWTATVSAAGPVTGAWAAVRYAAQPWGTELEVQVTGIRAGTRCRLEVTGARGQDVAAGGWTITAGSQHAWYPASVPFRPGSLRGFAVTSGGKTLVDLPVR